MAEQREKFVEKRVAEQKEKHVEKRRGLSQVALAEKSGVSLRAIQQYEQRCKDINHGQGASLYRLAQTLGCRIEDLLEYPL